MLPPRSSTRRPDENASPAAAYCRDSDWGSPPPYPVREAPNDSRRVLSPSQGTNTLTPPPLPRRDEDAASGLRPDWTKMSQAPSSAGKGITPASLHGTPLPRRRSAHGLGTPASSQRYRAGEPAVDESVDYGVATEDWDAFYAGQASTPFVNNRSGVPASSQHKSHQLQRSIMEEEVPFQEEEAASPKPRTLSDVPELPPYIEYDDFGMPIERNPAAVGEATPLAAKRLIGVRPNNHSNSTAGHHHTSSRQQLHESSYAQNSSAAGTDANRSRRRLATTLQFASPGAVAIDRVLDRIAGADDDMPRPFPDGTPGSTDVDYSPDGNRSAHDKSVSHAAIPMEEFSPGRAPASASPSRTHRSRARIVAIGGAIGLTVSAATLAGLGIAGLLG